MKEDLEPLLLDSLPVPLLYLALLPTPIENLLRGQLRCDVSLPLLLPMLAIRAPETFVFDAAGGFPYMEVYMGLSVWK